MKSILLVAHCVGYSRVLAYQLSSLILHPPQKVAIIIHVWFALEDDATHAMLRYFDMAFSGTMDQWVGKGRRNPYRLQRPPEVVPPLPNVTIEPQVGEWEEVNNRSIGRNLSALGSTADVVWFADCDHVFGPGCLDSLADLPGDSKLYFPRQLFYSKTRETGDDYARRVTKPGIYSIDTADFIPYRNPKATGGIQIVPGDVARQYGYCPNEPKWQKPSPTWKQTGADKVFRIRLGTDGTPINIPNLYRIRQSQEGEVDSLT